MPAAMVPSQQDIDGILKRVDHSMAEFSSLWQQATMDAASDDIRIQHSQLKKLSNVLQQHRQQLQSLTSKGGVRKAQREKITKARVSIERELENFKGFDHPIKVKELAVTSNSEDCKSEASGSDCEVLVAQKDIKVQWDQLHKEVGEDSEMLEEFICKICLVHVVGCGPKLARCSHLFCGDCIAKWFQVQPQCLSWAQRAQSGGLVPCPVCKEPLHQERDLFPVCPTGPNESALLWRLLSGVKINCSNNPKCREDGRCTWSGEYGSYQKHIQSCTNVPLDNACLPLPVPAVSKVCCREQQKESATPDLNAHQTASTIEVADSSPTPPKTAEAAKTGNLTDLIQQLVELEVTNGSGATLGSGSESQLLQQAAQKKLDEPAQAVSVVQAVHPYIADGASQLRIATGDLIQVLNDHPSGWTYGRKVSEASEVVEEESEGWFPNWAIA